MAIKVTRDGYVATVTIANADSLNALTLADMTALGSTWEELDKDDSVRVVILTGEGDKAFCCGGNLKEFIPLLTTKLRESNDPVKTMEGYDILHKAFIKGDELTKPLIAAVNGYCFAGGVELLNATDIRVAVEDAVFSLQEPKWALFPGGGSTVRIPRQIPYPWAMEILLVGGRLSAQEAQQAGLIGRVVPREKLWETVNGLARKIAENGPLAVRNIKRSALACLNLTLPEAFKEECKWAAATFTSDDAVEGPKAFQEKRKPNFKGK